MLRRPPGLMLAACLTASLGVCSSGCALFETASATATQSTALSSLTNWFSQPIEMAAGFDVESIKPDPQPATLVAENLLEITIWDLYEPGKPYTFPVRVSSRQTIEVPFLGEIPVEGRGVPELENVLVEGFRNSEYLLNPRILVRSLDPSVIKVQVTGAVNRSGFAEISRTDPTVYAALVSAGGLKKTAGTQVGVTRRAGPASGGAPALSAGQSQPADESAARGRSAPPSPGEQRPAALRANSIDELSVSAAGSDDRARGSKQALFSIIEADRKGELRDRAAPNVASGSAEAATVWYDASLAPDRDRLRLVQLADGDIVTVKAAAQPLRIGGVVNRPGAYPLPAGRSLNVWQAIDLAGGIRDENAPLNITLLRPAGEGRAARRWYLNVANYDQHPAISPSVEPGDGLHVEPTAGSRIRRAVGDLWNKP
jgi:protein involved in polysaccharide export with SLBB domain